MSLLILSAGDVAKVSDAFQLHELEALMSKVFSAVSDPTFPHDYCPPRTIIPTDRHKVLFMPSRMPGTGTSIKVVSVPTSASAPDGLPGTTMVLDEATGAIKAVVNARSLTALRNAAGSLLSTRLVGPSQPTSIVTFGAGKQVETHLDLHLRAYPSIRDCVIVNRSHNARLSALGDFIAARHPRVQVECIGRGDIASDEAIEQRIREHVGRASIIVCATSSTIPLFPSKWVKNGTHIILIGSYTPQMHEIDTDLVLRACNRGTSTPPPLESKTDRVLLVDSREACLKEAGELIDANVTAESLMEIGHFINSRPSINVNRDVVVDDTSSRSGGVTIFKSVGIGMQDVAIACATVNKAMSMQPPVGTIVEGYDAA